MEEEIITSIDLALRARCTLMVMHSQEELRVVKLLAKACSLKNRPCLSWDIAESWQEVTPWSALPGDGKSALEALCDIEKSSVDGVFILKDFHLFWEDPIVLRTLRTLTQRLRLSRKSLVIVTPKSGIPVELADEALEISVSLPDESVLSAVLSDLMKTPNLKIALSDEEQGELVRAALGLTERQAQRIFSEVIVDDGKLDSSDILFVFEQKKQLIKSADALEFVANDISEEDVGGLVGLKNWLHKRERAFSKEAREFGLPFPKGLALIGIPGTGKSLASKLVASSWKLPLLRFDVGSVFSSYLGQTEEKMRRALEIAERVSPCVLWIDELEKCFSQGQQDGGTSQRVFGSFLTWMSENKSPVFVTATANDISKLPPELLRRGRFDEIFFLGLPGEDEREAIFDVHLGKVGREAANYSVSELVKATEGFVGAEIEHVINDGLYSAFSEHRELVFNDVVDSISKTVPIAISHKEQIAVLNRFLEEGRALRA